MRIKFIIATITLFSTLTVMYCGNQTNRLLPEEKSLTTISTNSLDTNKNIDKSLTLEKAIKSGYVVNIEGVDFVSNKTNTNAEVYNISKLDTFMDSIDQEKPDKISIVIYAYKGGRTWVNKLYDLDYTGKEIKLVSYDTYSDPNIFLPSETTYLNRVTMRNYSEHLWYGAGLVGDKKDNSITLVSLKKNSIVK